tara:strand:+ start:126 stop:770 length:645 start_codon:yes stop_codon:yes gene_type:complete
MKFLGYDNVLCMSPHPDDIEYGLIGTIIKYHETNFHIFCMTMGGIKFMNSVDRTRWDEVRNAWKTANIKNSKLIFTDCEYFEEKDRDSEWVNYTEKNVLKNQKFDCLFVPTKDDSMFEHRFVNNLAAPLARHAAISIIEYKTPSTLTSWVPNLYVDIEEQYNTKLKCLNCFKSQLQKSYFSKTAIDAFHINYQLAKKGFNHVEQLKIIELYDKI